MAVVERHGVNLHGVKLRLSSHKIYDRLSNGKSHTVRTLGRNVKFK